MKPTIYYLTKERHGYISGYKGTLKQLCRHFLGEGKRSKTIYTLKDRINREVDYRYGCCYERPYVYVATEAEYEQAEYHHDCDEYQND